MELRHLRYLIAVAEERSFVAAAAKLALAQPALSRQIRDLETELGVEMFVREASGSSLTTAGEAVLCSARRILESVGSAIERAQLAERGLAGRCVLGAGRYPLWNGHLAKLIEQVRGEYPGIEIVVDERSLRAQWDALANCEIDLALGTAPPGDLANLVVETHSLDIIDSIVVAKGHALAENGPVSFSNLAKFPFVRYAPGISDEPTRIFQAELTARGLVPIATRQAANDDALRMLVRSGAGWSALPRSLRNVLPRDLVAVVVSDMAVPFRYVHMHRRGEDRPVVRSVLSALRRASRQRGMGPIAEPDSGVKAVAGRPDRTGFASRVELRHLRYFAAVVEHETIGRAADHLEITQPALSRQLRDLEEEIGATLLNRTARGVEPTLAGETLRSDALRIIASADQLSHEAHRAVRGSSGRSVVGVASSPLVWEVITRAVAACAASHPDLDVTVEDVSTPKQGAALRGAKIDLAIGHHYPSLPDMDQSMVRIPLVPDTLDQALVSVNHPLALEQAINVGELGDLPFLFMKRAFSPNFHDQVMSAFARAGYAPRIEGEYDGLPTVWALSAQNMGWCLGSSSQREYAPNGLVAVQLLDFSLPWGCELSYRRDEGRNAVHTVMGAIREAARGLAMASMTSKEMKYWPQSAMAG
jgi:DNA-binding transcriptional LysR family regulator